MFWKQKWPYLEQSVMLRVNLEMPDDFELAANASDSWLAWLEKCIRNSH